MSDPQPFDEHAAVRVLGYLMQCGVAEYVHRRPERPNGITQCAWRVIGEVAGQREGRRLVIPFDS